MEGNVDKHFPLCSDCDAEIESVLGAGFEGCQYGPEGRADAFNEWHRMKWMITGLFVRVAELEDDKWIKELENKDEN